MKKIEVKYNDQGIPSQRCPYMSNVNIGGPGCYDPAGYLPNCTYFNELITNHECAGIIRHYIICKHP